MKFCSSEENEENKKCHPTLEAGDRLIESKVLT